MAQKIRVFKLAQEFGLENEILVQKIRGMDIEIRNYMSALSPEDAQKVRRILETEREENTVEELIRPTVIRRRMRDGAPAKPMRKRPPKVQPAEAEERAADLAAKAAVRKRAKPKAEPIAPIIVPPSALPEPAQQPAAEADLEPGPEPLVEVPAAEGSDGVAVDAAMESVIEMNPSEVHGLMAEPEAGKAKRVTKVEVASGPAVLRPSSEAPIVKRRVSAKQAERARAAAAQRTATARRSSAPIEQIPDDLPDPQQLIPLPPSTGRRGKAPQRRREIESRDIAPSGRFTGVGPARGKFGTAVAPGRKRRMAPGKKGKKTEITTPKASKRIIRIEDQINLQELAKRMGVKATELLMQLIGLGVGGVNINSSLDFDTARIVASEFEYEVENVAVGEEDLLSSTRGVETDEDMKDRSARAPVITMMGHVDHGKTSLLDAIRKADVASSEIGGITQHIGAYRVKTKAGTFVFIDTPGHEAFTAMRARGANATDIVVLVVAADDGVMPQTIEAINHSRAAEVPIVVAVNKCDLPGADPERARRTLMEHNLVPEELGGDIIMCEVSAKTGQGLDRLLEMLSLQGEILEVSANPKKQARGVVLEAYLDRGRGPVANILVQDGTLELGHVLVAGTAYGKIRAITDDRGNKLKEAGPSTPVEVLGLSNVPQAGDPFDAVGDMKVAEKVGASRAEKQRASLAGAPRPSLESLYEQMQGSEQVELKVIIKADVQGSTEALTDALQKISTTKVKVTIIHASVGGITESDILLASTSGAVIIGFNVRPAGKAKSMATEQDVEIRLFSVIYDVIDEMKKAMIGLLGPTKQEEILGQVEVRDTFSVPKVGTIAGSYVTEGKVVRNARARLIRDSVQIWEGRVGSLRRFKDDVKEVQTGFECGISLDGYNDIKIKDIIEIYTEKEVEATLS